jgi:hypothetical protein
MKTPEDNYTSTVDGAAGYERMRAERDDHNDTPSRRDLMDFRDIEPGDDDDFDNCNCSDPGCPCGGHKIGGV